MDDKENITHLRWMHTTIAGFCISFFLVLLSGYDQIPESKMLYISIIFFAAAIPFSTACAVFHFHVVEQNIPSEAVFKVLDTPNADRFTKATFILVISGFTFLVGHYSVLAFFVFIVLSVACYKWLQPFLRALEGHAKPVTYRVQTLDKIENQIIYKGHKHK